MKTANNLYQQICSRENILLAHKNARTRKSHYHQVQTVDKNVRESEDGFGTMLYDLQQSMINHTYRTSKYVKQTKLENGKIRDLYKLPYYPDRIVQWAILQVIEPYITKNFISHTYSAIPERGTHMALADMRRAIYNNTVDCRFCLKIDIKHYYQSINHEILKDKLRTIFRDKELLQVLDEIIDSIATADEEDLKRLKSLKIIDYNTLTCYIKGRKETPQERYNRYINSEVGIPIGNYFSQYAGNFYLSSLDHYIKEQLHVKVYYRYMDDLVIFGRDKNQLRHILEEITRYCEQKLLLKLKPNYQIFPSFVRGIDYLGYRTFFDYTLLRKSTCITMKRKLTRMLERVKHRPMTDREYSSFNSYMGLLKPCDSHRLEEKYCKPLIPYVLEYECTHNLHSKRRKAYGKLWVNTIQRSPTGEESGRI